MNTANLLKKPIVKSVAALEKPERCSNGGSVFYPQACPVDRRLFSELWSVY
jgi:hypothetical protein